VQPQGHPHPIIDAFGNGPRVCAVLPGARLGCRRPAIVNAVQQLTDSGVLVPWSDSRKNKAWEAPDPLDAIVGLEEGARA
jgi:hypothetical protein